MHQKKKLRVANANAIAVLQLPSLYGYVIDKGAVQTIEIEDYKIVLLFINAGMPARDRGVSNAERCGSFSSDNDGQIFDSEDAAFESSGYCSQSRVHLSLRVSFGVDARPSLRAHPLVSNSRLSNLTVLYLERYLSYPNG
jgi:hypothetical protein